MPAQMRAVAEVSERETAGGSAHSCPGAAKAETQPGSARRATVTVRRLAGYRRGGGRPTVPATFKASTNAKGEREFVPVAQRGAPRIAAVEMPYFRPPCAVRRGDEDTFARGSRMRRGGRRKEPRAGRSLLRRGTAGKCASQQGRREMPSETSQHHRQKERREPPPLSARPLVAFACQYAGAGVSECQGAYKEVPPSHAPSIQEPTRKACCQCAGIRAPSRRTAG